MAPIGKKNRCGRSQLRPIGLRFPISSSFCFRRALFLPPRLPLSVSGTMAPIRKQNRSEKSQLRRFRKMEKKVSKLRAEQICAKESLEKDKAKAEEKAIKLAEERRLLELRKKENACSERCIDLTFDICAAEAQCDFARAELLKHSRSELLAEMNEEIQAFMNAGGSLDD